MKDFRPGVVSGQVVLTNQRKAARSARHDPTASEARAWALLRNRQILGLKFRREQVVQGLRVDLYCAAHRLAVEIDRGVHDDPGQQERDAQRTLEFARLGIHVARIRYEDVTATKLQTLLSRKGMGRRVRSRLAPRSLWL